MDVRTCGQTEVHRTLPKCEPKIYLSAIFSCVIRITEPAFLRCSHKNSSEVIKQIYRRVEIIKFN